MEETELTPPQTGGGGSDTVTMTQAALDASHAERAARAAKNARAEILQKLGVDSEDALQTIIREHRDHQQSLLTEQERLQTNLTAAQQVIAQREQELVDAQKRLETSLIQSAVKMAAQSAQFLPEALGDVWLLVKDDETLMGLLIPDPKTLSVTGAEDVIKKVAELRPHWLAPKKSPGIPPGRGQTAPNPVPPKTDSAPQPLAKF